MENFLVLDIGGSAIKYAKMDKDATILEKNKVKTPLDSLEALIEAIGTVYDQYKNDVKGIAISMPGVLDANTGQMHTGGALAYNEGINFIDVLQKRCPIDITIENDGKCGALAELWKGSLQDVKDGAVILLGTGVGGGIVIDGKLHKGHYSFAGEFSFIRTNSDNPKDLRSWWGFRNGSRALTLRGAQVKGVEEMDGHQFFQYANDDDEEILTILDEFTKQVAIQIINLQCVISPQKVAIGGGISAQPLLIEYIRKNVQQSQEGMKSPIKLYRPEVEIVPCEFRNDSNLIGALYHHLNLKK